MSQNQVLGELGKAYKYAIETLNIGRIGIGAQVLYVETAIECDYTETFTYNYNDMQLL